MSNAIYPIIGKEKILPFYLSGIGISDTEYHVKRESGLISHQFLFTKKGKGRLIIDGHSYLQQKGSFFYLPPDIPHEYYPEHSEWTTCWIVFRGEGLPDFMKRVGFLSWLTKDLSDLKQLEHIFTQLYTAAKDPLRGGETCSLLIYEYILLIKEKINSSNTKLLDSGNVLEKSLQYIDENFRLDISLDQLAETANMSRQHYCRIFKARIGMRPMEYVAQRRIAEAKLLLDTSTISISEIGRLSGYPDATYFGMVFRKYEGISPSMYRRMTSFHRI